MKRNRAPCWKDIFSGLSRENIRQSWNIFIVSENKEELFKRKMGVGLKGAYHKDIGASLKQLPAAKIGKVWATK